MKILDTVELMQEYAKTANKPCMYISYVNDIDTTNNIKKQYKEEQDNVDEIIKAAPYLDKETVFRKDYAVLVFDTEKEMYDCYDKTVGDDGQTIHNSYKGSARVYALICNNKGELETENT